MHSVGVYPHVKYLHCSSLWLVRYPIKEFTNSSLKVKAYFPLIYYFMTQESIFVGCVNPCFQCSFLTSALSAVFLGQIFSRLNSILLWPTRGDDAVVREEKVSAGMAAFDTHFLHFQRYLISWNSETSGAHGPYSLLSGSLGFRIALSGC